jgi:hypothetical protein
MPIISVVSIRFPTISHFGLGQEAPQAYIMRA